MTRRMTVGLHSRDAITPVTSSFDFRVDATQFDQVGPYWLSLLAWVSTSAALTGALQFGMTHRDPAGNDILSPTITGLLVLADGTSIFSTAPEMIYLQNTTSLWTFDTTLLGLALTSKVSYRMMVYPLDPGDYSPF